MDEIEAQSVRATGSCREWRFNGLVTEEDSWEFFRLTYLCHHRYWKTLYLWPWCAALVCGALAILAGVHATYVIIIVLAGPTVFYLWVLLSYWGLRQGLKTNRDLLDDHEITASESGLTMETRSGRSDYQWQMVAEIAVSKEILAFMLSQKNQVVCVARRKLDDPSRWPELIEFLRTKRP